MMLTPHALTGAAISKVWRRPWLAYPVAFASHFVLDFIPHTDQHALFGVAGGGVTPGEIVASAADLFIAVAALTLLIGTGKGDRHHQSGASPLFRKARTTILWGGAVIGAVMDILDNVPLWNQGFRAIPGMAALSEFHHGIQNNLPASMWPLGMGTQLAVALLAAWMLVRKMP